MLRPLVTILLLACATACTPADPVDPPTDQAPPAWRRVEMRQRSSVFREREPRAITTQEALDELTASWGERPHTGGREIAEALVAANIDFERETLVLITVTESSGSVKVRLEGVDVVGDKAVCSISRSAPDFGTADMAYHGFALVVSKDIKTMHVWVEGDVTHMLDLRE
jgi:hypothetical protein